LVALLNLIWLFVALAALGTVLLSEQRRPSSGAAARRRLVSVLLVTVSLFPCVSASDDLINFAYVSAGLETRSGFGHTVPRDSDAPTVIYLVLQSLEHLQITACFTLSIAVCFFGFVFCMDPTGIFRQLPSSVSRGPPSQKPSVS